MISASLIPVCAAKHMLKFPRACIRSSGFPTEIYRSALVLFYWENELFVNGFQFNGLWGASVGAINFWTLSFWFPSNLPSMSPPVVGCWVALSLKVRVIVEEKYNELQHSPADSLELNSSYFCSNSHWLAPWLRIFSGPAFPLQSTGFHLPLRSSPASLYLFPILRINLQSCIES